jgi:hypothetical protein
MTQKKHDLCSKGPLAFTELVYENLRNFCANQTRAVLVIHEYLIEEKSLIIPG